MLTGSRTLYPIKMEILYQDEYLIVCNKPSGLLAVPGRGPDKQDCLSARVQAFCPDALIVHRLDYDTSGIMLMARGIEAQRRVNLAFEKRVVHLVAAVAQADIAHTDAVVGA